MFTPTENPTLDPVWSSSIRNDNIPEKSKPWQANVPNLPSFYTNWSPASTRRPTRPAAVLTPCGDTADPKPIHFNRPSPGSSPVNVPCYRRVLFRADDPNITNFSSSTNIPSPHKYTPDTIVSKSVPETKCQFIPQKECLDQTNIKETKTKREPTARNETALHSPSESGHSAKRRFPLTHTYSDPQSSFSLSGEKSSESIYMPKMGTVTDGVDPTSAKGGVSKSGQPQVTQRVADSNQVSVNGAAVIQPPWRSEKRYCASESKIVTSSTMVSVKSETVRQHSQQEQVVHYDQQQMQNQQQTAQVQQQYHQEAPWRSPRANRRVVNQPKAPINTSQSKAQNWTKPQSISPTGPSQPSNVSPNVVPDPSQGAHQGENLNIAMKPVSDVPTSRISSNNPSTVVAVSAPIIPAVPNLPQISSPTNVSQQSSKFPRRPLATGVYQTEALSPPPPAPNTNILTNKPTDCIPMASTVVTLEANAVEPVKTIDNEKIENMETKVEPSHSEILIEKKVSSDIQDTNSNKLAELPEVSKILSENVQVKETQLLEEKKKVEPVIENVSENTTESVPKQECSDLIINQPNETVNIPIEQLPSPPPPLPPKTQHSKEENITDEKPKVDPIHQPIESVVKFENTEGSQQIGTVQHPTTLTLIDQTTKATSEPEKKSPEYVNEPITNRIMKFEKQGSFDADKQKERSISNVKPVGPWVKRTSSGLVTQGEGWESPEEGSGHRGSENLPYVNPERQMIGDPSVSTSVPIIPHTFKEQKLTQPAHISPVSVGRPPVYERPHPDYRITKEATRMDGIPIPSPALTNAPEPLKEGDPLFDPWCDASNPRVIQFQDVSAAAFRIKAGIINTPCTYSNMSNLVGMEIFFKKEFNQYTGSFKERGARYTLLCLSDDQKKKGVIAASAGNHALALSYHGQDLGIPVTVVMPLVAPIMKVQACRQYGANIIVKGYDIGECREIALEKARDNGLLYLNGYDHPHIIAGQGTMGLEIVEQVKNIDAVVIPVGGGGLIAGVALAVKSLYPNICVIGVEAEKCPSFTAALKANKPVVIKSESTLADGLAVPCVGVNAFATASKLIDKVITVKEEWIAIAILRLVEMEKAVVEGAGATGLAAVLAGDLPELKGKRVVIPLCGGNIDTTVLGRCLERGLAADGRLVKFTVTVSDRPGGIAELTRILANLGVSIKDMMHERAWIKNDIFSVEVKCLCETRDEQHSEQLRETLRDRYKLLRFKRPHLLPL